MAYQFSASFDYLTTASQLFDTVSGAVAFNSASARFTSTHGQGVSFPQNSFLKKILPSSQPTLIMGAAVKFGSLNNNTTFVFGLFDTNGSLTVPQTCLVVNSAGALQFYRGTPTTNAIGAASASVISAGAWHFIEIQVTINNSTGSVQAWVDGNSVIGPTGSLNTRSQTLNSANMLSIGDIGGGFSIGTNMVMDDLYCFDTTGSVLNSVAGDSRFVVAMPSGPGAYTQFTPAGAAQNWQCVDEIPPNDDTDYVADGTTGDRDSYDYESQSFSGNAIMVVPWARVRKDDAASRSIELSVLNGGNDAFSSSIPVLSTYSYVNGGAFTTNPNGGGAIDQTAFNATEFGAKIVSPGEIPLTFGNAMSESDSVAKTLA